MTEKEKVVCQYCGKEYSKSGIANHEKACPENPANKADEVEVIEAEPTVKKEKLVEVKVNRKISCYIGDRYYRFEKGEKTKVPIHVKDILLKAGLLEAI